MTRRTSARAHVGRQPGQGHRVRGVGTVRAGRRPGPGCAARGRDLLASLPGAVPGRPAPHRGPGRRRGDRPHARTRRRVRRPGLPGRLGGPRRGQRSAASSPSPTPRAASWPSGETRPPSPGPPRPTWRPGSAGPSAATGTNGMGTALEAHGPVLVRGAEHWCQAFHDWVCAGIAVRDVVTREPIAVLNISCWRSPLPAARGRLAGERGHQDPVHAEAARPRQRCRAGGGLHAGQGTFR